MTVPPAPVHSDQGPSPRIDWIDGARGSAMILLLIWHAASIPEVLGTPMPHAFEVLNDGLRLVRMPLLMFLSGHIVLRALSRPVGVYYRRKLATLAWPYVLWGLLDLTTFEHQPLDVPWSWDGTGYLWFLFFVLLFSLVAPLLRRVPSILVAAAAFVGASTLHLPFPDDTMLLYAVFFFAGLAAAESPATFERILRSPVIVGVCAVIGVATGVGGALDLQINVGHTAPLALAGVVAVIAGLSRIRRFPRRITGMGRTSIVWYLVHFPVMHLVTVALRATGLDLPWIVYFVVGLGTVLLVCPVMVRLSDRVPVSYLFSAPPPLAARVDPAGVRRRWAGAGGGRLRGTGRGRPPAAR